MFGKLFAPKHKHEWKTVAVTSDYTTTNTDGSSSQHVVEYQRCECDQRRLHVCHSSDARCMTRASYHAGIIHARSLWEAGNYVHTNINVVYTDPRFAPHYNIGKWEIDFRADERMSALMEENSNVKDAFDNLIAMIKLAS
jgi:hypothetical protein